jgi:phosphoribosylformylglycinamidine synthase
MSAYEILLSESQERMLMVVEPQHWAQLCQVLQKWQLAHAVVGVVTDTGRMQISYRGHLEVDLPVAPLTDRAPVYQRPLADQPSSKQPSKDLLAVVTKLAADGGFFTETFLDALKDTGSKQPIFEQYDRHIGTKSVLGPEHGGAAVMWIRSDETKDVPWLGAAMAAGCNERRVKNRPLIGAAEAVLKCARQLWAAGGEPLAITDCLNFGNPEHPDVMREFSDSVDGITKACTELEVPVVSGNVSLYNATGVKNIHPTPMIGMVGRVNDVRSVTPSICVSDASSVLYMLAPAQVSVSFVASLAAKIHGIAADDGWIEDINWQSERSLAQCLQKMRDKGVLAAVRDIGEGGALVSATKMLAGVMLEAVSLDLRATTSQEALGEGGARYLVQVKSGSEADASQIAASFNLTFKPFLDIHKDDRRVLRGFFGEISLVKIASAFRAAQPIGG